MKTIIRILLIGAISWFVQQYFLYWSAAATAFLLLVLIPSKSSRNAFICGFLGIGLLWTIIAWRIDHQTGSILTERVAGLFHLARPIYLVLITGLTGGILGGFAALAGYKFSVLFKKKSSGYYR
jgi:hypothetical protein